MTAQFKKGDLAIGVMSGNTYQIVAGPRLGHYQKPQYLTVITEVGKTGLKQGHFIGLKKVIYETSLILFRKIKPKSHPLTEIFK